MNVLEIKETEDTPGIMLNKESKSYKFFGKSMPEDVESFYSPVIDWFKEFSKNPDSEVAIDFDMEYFNTSSSKKFLDIIYILKDLEDSGKTKVKINWYFLKDDEDMKYAGEEYKDIVDIDVTMIEK